MAVTFVIILFFRVLSSCQAQNNENCALTKAKTGELGIKDGYKSKKVIGGHDTDYAPWQVSLVAGVNIIQTNSIRARWDLTSILFDYLLCFVSNSLNVSFLA